MNEPYTTTVYGILVDTLQLNSQGYLGLWGHTNIHIIQISI